MICLNVEKLTGRRKAAGADLFGGEAVKRGSGDAEKAEIKINLAAMMDFVFEHEAEPLPGGDGGVVGSLTFALEVGVGEAREDFDRFGVETLHEGENVFETVGEIFFVRGVAGGTALHGFGPHVTLGDGDVAQKIAERELSWYVGPIDFIGRDAARHAQGTLAYIFKIFRKWLDGDDFHGALAKILNLAAILSQ